MSQLRYDQQIEPDPGWGCARVLVCLVALVALGPALLLGGAGLLVWRYFGWRQRWAVVVLALSLVPAAAAAYFWHANPFAIFLMAHLAAVGSGLLRLMGRADKVPLELTPLFYLVGIAPTTVPLAVLVGFAISRITGPRASLLRWRQATAAELPRHVERRAARGVKHPPDGWALGYRADGRVVAFTDAESRQHVIVCGATGAGKTTVVRHVLDGVADRCPVVILDCKASLGLRRAVASRPGSLVWTIGGRLRWDALRGDPTCFASKLLVAEQFGPNAAIYRAAAERYAQWVGQLLAWQGEPRDPRRVAELLAPRALAGALQRLERSADPSWWAEHGEPLRQRLEAMGRAEQEGVAGFAARLGLVVEGAAGPSLGAGSDVLVLEEAVRGGRTVLFSLDAASYPTLAAKIGAWVLLDLVRLAALLQADEWAARRQLYVVVDEFSALREEGRHVVPLLARAREAGVACVVATQGLADLERVDRALPQQVVQNTAVRVLLRQGSAEDALAWARHVGEHELEELTRQLDYGVLLGGPETGRSSVRWRRDFNVRPDELQVLRTGDAVVDLTAVVGQRRVIERVRIARPQEPALSTDAPNLWTVPPTPDRVTLAPRGVNGSGATEQGAAAASRGRGPTARGASRRSRPPVRHAATAFEAGPDENGHRPAGTP